MLKILIMLAAIGLTPVAGAQAMTLNCGSPPDFASQGRHLKVKTQGRWEALGFGHTRLNYSLEYGIDCVDGGSCWATAQSQGAGILANPNYRPIHYHHYQQFVLDPVPAVEQSFLLLPEHMPAARTEFRAYLMLDSVHGSFGATVPLQCQGEPVSPFSSAISADAVTEIARADRIIQEDFGFPQLRLQADVETLQQQIDAGPADRVSVSKATQLALAVIFEDFEGIEAPLHIAADGWASTHNQKLTGKLNLDEKVEVRRFLREQMQNPKTSLSLYLGRTIQGQVYPPEQGESMQDNWIFFLSVPTLSDHLYWVIVDRKGQTAPYLYGFN
ncbi:hypothetical protein [Oligoflexus tunisiensis]|uniref:hypothetical protein n=1 Tax=Oligoflexus tunisiensis TaxID=708132 RepID=UPI00114CE5BD|nr:hypothetical protein [Oligoflexus tunisiensis]